MKIVTPSVSIINEPDILKRIELAGRVCYKSEDRITENSAEKFVRNIIKSGHDSVLEHSNIIIRANTRDASDYLIEILNQYEEDGDIPHYIRRSRWQNLFVNVFSGNARAWRSLVKAFPDAEPWCVFSNNVLFEDLKGKHMTYDEFWMPSGYSIIPYAPGKKHNIITSKFICSRGVSHELVRHRLHSFSQESTRYVRYSDIEYIEPWWIDEGMWTGDEKLCSKISARFEIFNAAAREAEARYGEYIASGGVAQLARGVLNHDTKTEVVLTATISQWERFITLRNSNAAHPDIRRLAQDFAMQTIDLRKEP